jgi:hypothetical protein
MRKTLKNGVTTTDYENSPKNGSLKQRYNDTTKQNKDTIFRSGRVQNTKREAGHVREISWNSRMRIAYEQQSRLRALTRAGSVYP